ncbi:MAG TPA: TlpA disulfide reductase family protein [Solirubrobacterales bacterium]|nr:TlpA disulfide reductase family protein [Solirubrobacterales bacterium]
MQRWLIRVALVAGLAVLAIGLAIRAQVHGGVAVEANRLPLHAERQRGPAAARGAAPSPLLAEGDLLARLQSLRGRPVVLTAWASWCPPCREELPLLASASARFGRRVAFLGADVEDDAGSARRLLEEAPLGYPSYTTSLAALGPLAPATGTPFTVLIAADGQVVSRRIGAYLSQSELDADISSLLSPHT